jgi:hypothetical protein
MIRKQNSEKIFLQPIDQQYDNTQTKIETDENKKFFDDYEHKIDYLNMSTDSETQLSRRNSFDDFEDLTKITSFLVEDWVENIEKVKNTHCMFLKGVIMQKMAILRGTLNNMNMINMQSMKNLSVQSNSSCVSDEKDGEES